MDVAAVGSQLGNRKIPKLGSGSVRTEEASQWPRRIEINRSHAPLLCLFNPSQSQFLEFPRAAEHDRTASDRCHAPKAVRPKPVLDQNRFRRWPAAGMTRCFGRNSPIRRSAHSPTATACFVPPIQAGRRLAQNLNASAMSAMRASSAGCFASARSRSARCTIL